MGSGTPNASEPFISTKHLISADNEQASRAAQEIQASWICPPPGQRLSRTNCGRSPLLFCFGLCIPSSKMEGNTYLTPSFSASCPVGLTTISKREGIFLYKSCCSC